MTRVGSQRHKKKKGQVVRRVTVAPTHCCSLPKQSNHEHRKYAAIFRNPALKYRRVWDPSNFPVQQIMRIQSARVKRQSRETDQFYLLPRLNMRGATPPLLHTSSRCGV